MHSSVTVLFLTLLWLPHVHVHVYILLPLETYMYHHYTVCTFKYDYARQCTLQSLCYSSHCCGCHRCLRCPLSTWRRRGRRVETLFSTSTQSLWLASHTATVVILPTLWLLLNCFHRDLFANIPLLLSPSSQRCPALSQDSKSRVLPPEEKFGVRFVVKLKEFQFRLTAERSGQMKHVRTYRLCGKMRATPIISPPGKNSV